jgi:hypothetical protein
MLVRIRDRMGQTRQTQDYEIIDFKTLLFVSKDVRFTRGKRVLSRKEACSRRASKNIVVLAQILAHQNTKLSGRRNLAIVLRYRLALGVLHRHHATRREATALNYYALYGQEFTEL